MDKGQEDEVKFVMPLLETTSSFRPNDFESKLLPPENKPLETAMLKRAKELFTSNDPKVIAQHMLSVDCKVGAWVGGALCCGFRKFGREGSGCTSLCLAL